MYCRTISPRQKAKAVSTLAVLCEEADPESEQGLCQGSDDTDRPYYHRRQHLFFVVISRSPFLCLVGGKVY